MIIKTLLKANHLIPRLISKTIIYNSSTTSGSDKQLVARVRSDLSQKLESMNIRTQKSIIIQQLQSEEMVTQPQDGQKELSSQIKKKKVNKYKFRVLTPQQKQQLGLMIPQSSFNLRMTRKCEQQYRQALCQNLYKAQKQNLQTSVRILQLQNEKMNIDQYINSLYKDIFARYMVSRGIGVDWEAKNSSYGVMNALQTSEDIQKQIKQFYIWLSQFIQEYPLHKKQILGLYSYSKKRFIKTSDVQIENIYKVGHFFTMEITQYGRFKDSFQVIKQRGQKIQLLIMIQDLIKLLNIQGVCIQPKKKMIILTKYKQQNVDQVSDWVQREEEKVNSYLITSMDVYTDHKDYFDSNGYKKHSIFDSEYLLEMKVSGNIKIYNDVEGYSRKGGAYIIDRYSGLPDFQRAHSLELDTAKSNNYIDSQGRIRIQGQKKAIDGNKQTIYITDPKYGEKLLKRFESQVMNFKKFDLYSTYEDQIYSYQGQKVHFVTSSKYVIPIPESNHQELQKVLQKSVISESKVKVPILNRVYPKPRDRRRHIKQIRNLKKQQTQYLSLSQCIQAIDQLPFSTIHQKWNMLRFPIFISQNLVDSQVKNQAVLMNSKIREVISQSIKIELLNDKQNKQWFIIFWDYQKLNNFVQQFNKQLTKNQQKEKLNSIIAVKHIYLTQDMLNGYKCLRGYIKNDEISNVVIQPQSKTQDVVPVFFHIHYMIHKMLAKRSAQNQKQRGRKVKNNRYYNKYVKEKLFSLVKFHPTIIQSQKNKNVDEVLFGVLKLNRQQQYGYGLQALRLWVARNDSYLGDRNLADQNINKQLQLSAFIRKMYWQLLPLTKINLDQIKTQDDQKLVQIIPGSNNIIPRQKLSYLHNFILDHINYYILNMQQCYTKLDLTKALNLTQDFFINYLNQIFVKPIRRRIISFPLNQDTKLHLYVIRRVLDLIGVITPLLPYSAFHISKTQLVKWPEVNLEDVRPQLVPNYNRMTKLRVQVRNKFLLNNFYHSQLVIPMKDIIQQQATTEGQIQNQNRKLITEICKLSKKDLQMFFDIQNISIEQPTQLGKSFGLKLKQNHPIGQIQKLKFYQYKDVCIRCSPNRNYGTHLCHKCLEYLNLNYGKSLPLIN